MLKYIKLKKKSLKKTLEFTKNKFFEDKYNKYKEIDQMISLWNETYDWKTSKNELSEQLEGLLENQESRSKIEKEIYTDLYNILKSEERPKFYVGIGENNPPQEITELMSKIAQKLEEEGYILRSNSSGIISKSFETGVNNSKNKELYLPSQSFEYTLDFIDKFNLKDIDVEKNKDLLARIPYQILGIDLCTPCDFLICWTNDGCISHQENNLKTGITAQAISIANYYGIPVFNLEKEEHKKRLIKFIGDKEEDQHIGQQIIKEDHPVTKNKFIVFDLETTGTSNQDKITEIGAIKIENGKVTDTFSTLVNPKRKINSFIQNLTGITNEMVKGAPFIEDILDEFIDFVEDGILIFHSPSNFDLRFINNELTNSNRAVLKNNYLDTVRLARKILPQLDSHKLNIVADYLDLEFNHHRATDDAFVTAQIFGKLVALDQTEYIKLELES
ncbi:PolC-type DNA polymerase III [Orenia marismortui]|uniref:DNA polymerase III epsilon subunit family exonuclease n=1 Tax=Orenia marismortui TaxID=46469 RepID=A0A4R8GZQ8_9FIRM|nr:3'-5' exonuclease [Orenia marismortui]TDX52340.1 DNA polymerase III epsilon subunit family exonuclease [Orenia marismortui]